MLYHGYYTSLAGKGTHLFDDITVDDARWMAHWLSQLSAQQIEDAFRAANYKPEEVHLLSGALRERIKELVDLPAMAVTSRSGQK
jgi:hypothetical protein